MSGSVVHSIEAQKYAQEQSSLGSLSSVSTTDSQESPTTARSTSDFTVNISEEAKNLLNEEQTTEQPPSDVDQDSSDREEQSGTVSDNDTSSVALTEEEQEEVDELESRDEEVRTHEQAHAAAGGQYAGSPSYSYEQGPDGKRYITDGEVQIDVSPISGDPQATIEKMKQVYRAALAPAEPSSADRAVAREAQAAIAEATSELASQVSSTSDTNESLSASNQSSTSVLTSNREQLVQQQINLYA